MPFDIMSDDFPQFVADATDCARRELLAGGVEVVYFDRDAGIDILERPDGRRFQIRLLPEGNPNYEIVRELPDLQAA
jgi:hypothetical protein